MQPFVLFAGFRMAVRPFFKYNTITPLLIKYWFSYFY